MERKPKARRRQRSGFTLTELLVAVLILIVVIIATSKIFGTVSNVTGLSQASADVLQEAVAIERQIRSDFKRLSRDGFFAIRCVAVQNGVNLPGGQLLDPSHPPDYLIRADQLVFFTHGTETIQTYGSTAGAGRGAQGSVSRVYYGHAFQVPSGPAVEIPGSAGIVSLVYAIDPPLDPSTPIVPWYNGPTQTFVKTRFQEDESLAGDYALAGTFPNSVDVRQPPATRWLLARQALVLAGYRFTDTTEYLGSNRIGRSIFHSDPNYSTPTPEALNGRVDAVASQLNDVRAVILDANGDGVHDPWRFVSSSDWQRNTISHAIYYPRAERVAPGMHRVDQALGAHVLASACSSFIVDWTYKHDTGMVEGTAFVGVNIPPAFEQQWLGLDDAGDPAISRQVFPLRSVFSGPVVPRALDHQNVDRFDIPNLLPDTLQTLAGKRIKQAGAFAVYEAIFGYNQDLPLDVNGSVWAEPTVATSSVAYTPWPAAIRITMRLHDAENRLEAGRVVQFVIDLPERN